MTRDVFRLVRAVWDEVEEPLARHLPIEDVRETSSILLDREAAERPRIMVFGAYNAGKSTLVNALLGEERAAVSDVPETDRVTTYEWRGFELDDTPGIGAPIEHEEVTRKHIEASDGVIFVLATDGTFAQRSTFDEIVEIVRAGKPIRVVLNNKTGLDTNSADCLEVMDSLLTNVAAASAAAGIENIEAHVPVRLVNARSALEARLRDKPNLLARSGLLEVEQDIEDLFNTTKRAERAKHVGRRIMRQIDAALAGMAEDDATAPLRDLNAGLSAERTRMGKALERRAQHVALDYKRKLSGAADGHDQGAADRAGPDAVAAMEKGILKEAARAEQELRRLGIAADDSDVGKHPSHEQFHIARGTPGAAHQSGLNDLIRVAGSRAALELGREPVVAGLLALKQLQPGMLKGLGPVFFSRVAQFAGAAVQVGIGVADFLKERREAARAFEHEKRAQARLEVKLDDARRSMNAALAQWCEDVVEKVFSPIEDEVAQKLRVRQGDAARIAADRSLLVRGHARLEVADLG